MRRALFLRLFVLATSLGAHACSDDGFTTGSPTGPGGAGGQAGNPGGAGMGGTGGAGGCATDADCISPSAAKCEGGACVPCDSSEQCEGLAGTEVCSEGACVECALGQEQACQGSESCDLVAKACVAVAPGSVDTCGACTNDVQCVTNHRCIPMDFPMGTAHGYYCLAEAMPTCDDRPYTVPINEASISGAPATNYCGINQDLATCEAVRALQDDWRCSGTDGMCSPDGMQPEVAVPGALCRQVGLTSNRCTYACNAAPQCPFGPPQSTCGDGPMNEGPPD